VRRGQGEPGEEVAGKEDPEVEKRNVRPRLGAAPQGVPDSRRWKQRDAGMGDEPSDHWKSGERRLSEDRPASPGSPASLDYHTADEDDLDESPGGGAWGSGPGSLCRPKSCAGSQRRTTDLLLDSKLQALRSSKELAQTQADLLLATDENSKLRAKLARARQKEKARGGPSETRGRLAPVTEDRRGEFEAEEEVEAAEVPEAAAGSDRVKEDCDAPMGAGPASARQAAITIAGSVVHELLNMASAEASANSGDATDGSDSTPSAVRQRDLAYTLGLASALMPGSQAKEELSDDASVSQLRAPEPEMILVKSPPKMPPPPLAFLESHVEGGASWVPPVCAGPVLDQYGRPVGPSAKAGAVGPSLPSGSANVSLIPPVSVFHGPCSSPTILFLGNPAQGREGAVHLNGVIEDLQAVAQALGDSAIGAKLSHCSNTGELSKALLLEKVRDHVRHTFQYFPGNPQTIIHYSGHGDGAASSWKKDAKSGDWPCLGSERVTLEDIWGVWLEEGGRTARTHLHGGRKAGHLVLILDCCYGGAWAEQAFSQAVGFRGSTATKRKMLDPKDQYEWLDRVFIQAASGPSTQAFDNGFSKIFWRVQCDERPRASPASCHTPSARNDNFLAPLYVWNRHAGETRRVRETNQTGGLVQVVERRLPTPCYFGGSGGFNDYYLQGTTLEEHGRNNNFMRVPRQPEFSVQVGRKEMLFLGVAVSPPPRRSPQLQMT